MPTARSKRIWPNLVLLFLVFALPIGGAAYRLITLAQAEFAGVISPEILRIIDIPLPLAVHALSGIIFCTLAILQFAPSLRAPRGTWHKYSGRVAVFAGLFFALSGPICLWVYDPAPDKTTAQSVFQFLGSFGVAIYLTIGLQKARNRQFEQHRAWMIRAIALTAGAAGQAYSLLLAELILGHYDQTTQAIFEACGWAASILIGEWIIRRSKTRPRPIPTE